MPPSHLPEHKIGVFVLFWPSQPSFSGISSTKSGFLCAFRVWNPRFRAFRAQNRGFCALLPFGTPIFWHFEHKNGIFVSETAIFPWFWLFPSTKSAFLCALPVAYLLQHRRPRHGRDCRSEEAAAKGAPSGRCEEPPSGSRKAPSGRCEVTPSGSRKILMR